MLFTQPVLWYAIHIVGLGAHNPAAHARRVL